MAFWKSQNYGDSGKITVAKGYGRGWDEQAEHGGCLQQRNYSVDTAVADTNPLGHNTE